MLTKKDNLKWTRDNSKSKKDNSKLASGNSKLKKVNSKSAHGYSNPYFQAFPSKIPFSKSASKKVPQIPQNKSYSPCFIEGFLI